MLTEHVMIISIQVLFIQTRSQPKRDPGPCSIVMADFFILNLLRLDAHTLVPSAHRRRRVLRRANLNALGVHRAIYHHVLKQRIVFPERRVESLAVCMPHMDKQCSNYNAKQLSLNAERRRLRCAGAFKRRRRYCIKLITQRVRCECSD